MKHWLAATACARQSASGDCFPGVFDLDTASGREVATSVLVRSSVSLEHATASSASKVTTKNRVMQWVIIAVSPVQRYETDSRKPADHSIGWNRQEI
jgi:hypothetical protein